MMPYPEFRIQGDIESSCENNLSFALRMVIQPKYFCPGIYKMASPYVAEISQVLKRDLQCQLMHAK